MLYQIQSSYFTAGCVSENEKIIVAAPIIKYMIGWTEKEMIQYCQKKNWQTIKIGQ